MQILTERPLRKRFFRNDEPHLVYHDGELDDLFGINSNEFDVDLNFRRFFGDGGLDNNVGAELVIS